MRDQHDDEVILDGKGAKQADELASLSPRVFLPQLQSARVPRRSRNASKPLVYETVCLGNSRVSKRVRTIFRGYAKCCLGLQVPSP